MPAWRLGTIVWIALFSDMVRLLVEHDWQASKLIRTHGVGKPIRPENAALEKNTRTVMVLEVWLHIMLPAAVLWEQIGAKVAQSTENIQTDP